MINLNVRGVEQLKAKLSKLPQYQNQAMKTTVLFVHSKVPKYPQASPTSTYRRTGTLGRSVTTFMGSNPDALSRVEDRGKDVHGFIGTRLKYAIYVIDKVRQARWNVGRWYTLQDVVFGLRHEIVNVYRTALIKLIK